MSRWQETTLGDLLLLQRGLDLPERARRPGRYSVLGSNGPVGCHDEARVRGPGVVIGRATNLGRPTYWAEDFWPLNTCLYVKDFRGADPRFVYYLFESLDLSGFDSGSVQPMLNRNYVAKVPLLVPGLAEQRAIAGVLGALDDKIESNRRASSVLAALIETEFDKAVIGAPGVPYGEALVVQMGAPFSGDHFANPGVGRPLIRIRDLKTLAPQVWTTELRSDEIVVTQGDVLVGMDAEFRSTLWLGEDGVLNQRVCRFAPLPHVGSAFALLAIRQDLEFCERAKSGTTVIHLNKSDIVNFQVPSLTTDEHRDLRNLTEPLVQRLVSLSNESRLLAGLRDGLLPELLSGRLRVRDAELLVEEVA